MRDNNIKLAVAGYGEAALTGLSALFAEGLKHEQILLFTHPNDDRNNALLSFARVRLIEYSVDSLESDANFRRIKQFKPDIILSLHYRKRITRSILEAARCGGINLHPSLLPKYRGANSIPWAIINGEKQTGITIHWMTENFDEGAILLQESYDISAHDTAFSLFNKSILLGAKHIVSAIDAAVGGEKGTPQPPGGSYFSRQLPFDGYVDPRWPESRIERFIRAMYFPPFIGARLKTPAGNIVEISSASDVRINMTAK
ncbi:MAG TPA: methionyl-tRNA formyltransferase [Methylocella sp.]|nr:methionyl-tRNA formyltransferase [Methylocella sp.]